MLVLRSVSYRYPGTGRPQLRDIDLAVEPGNVVGVSGANDAGKSTLCLVLSGLAPRLVGGDLSGDIEIDGTDASPLAMHALVERVGIVFQNPRTQLSGVTATVFEEVAFGAANLGVPRAELLSRVGRALDRLQIRHLAAREPSRLSGGQMQLVAIAGVLTIGARYAVLDEPTAQLDPAGTALVAEALRDLAGEGVGIVIAEHKTELLEALCKHVVVLDGGSVAMSGTAAKVLSDPALESLGVAPPARIAIAARLAAAGVRVTGALAAQLGTGS
jgi:energy-coupling factor transporter ATP-binding protein EcfA2